MCGVHSKGQCVTPQPPTRECRTLNEFDDIFSGSYGYADQLRSRYGVAAQAIDSQLDNDLQTALQDPALRTRLQPSTTTPRRILAQVFARHRSRFRAARIATAIRSTRGPVTISIDPRPLPKFAKLNDALSQAAQDNTAFDWLLLVDDDVAFPPDLVDVVLDAAEAAHLLIAQPAHRIHSYAAYTVTQRAPRSLIRATSYVEGGPIVALHHSVLPHLAPFPTPKDAWGVDFLWSDMARRRAWPIGVIDAATFEHLRPIASDYRGATAMADTRALLAQHGFAMTRHELFHPGRIILGW